MKKRFRVELSGTGPRKDWPFFELPFDPEEVFGRGGRLPVTVTVRGKTLRTRLGVYGGKYFVGFKRAFAEEARVKAGQTVQIEMARDDAERTVRVPPALAAALRKDTAARRAWDALSYSHQREHAEAIESAKREETRARRVEKCLAMLRSGGRSGAPARSGKPLAQRLLVKEGMNVAVLDPPKGFELGAPFSKKIGRAPPDVLLAFVRNQAEVEALARKVLPGIAGARHIWLAYPKTTSGVETDLTRDRGWGPVEALGYGGVAQVAVDSIWTATRFRR